MASQSVLQRFLRRCADAPNSEFLCIAEQGQWSTFDYGETLARSCQYANHFRSLGLNEEDVVLIVLHHSPEQYFAFIGAIMAGCVPSFMPPLTAKQDARLYWQGHDELFRRIDVKAVVTYAENQQALRDNITAMLVNVITPNDVVSAQQTFSSAARSSSAIAVLQHSSGTTGLKKGVALSHLAIIEQVASYSLAIGLRPGDRIGTWLPLYHDMGLIACFMTPLLTDAAIVAMDPFAWTVRPAILLEAVERFDCRFVWLPNFAFHHLVRTHDKKKTYKLDGATFINCSEPCKPETFDIFERTFAASGVSARRLQVCYAMAETVFAVTQTRIGSAVDRITVDLDTLVGEGRLVPAEDAARSKVLLSVGNVIDGLSVRVLDPDGRQCPENHVGEVAVCGRCLFSGYYRLPEETARSFSDGWYRTGDQGVIADGQLFITGRLKDLIIVHGKNFYAHDIEAIVNGVPGIKAGRAVAVGMFNEVVGSEDLVVIAETELPAGERQGIQRKTKLALESSLGVAASSVHLVEPGWLIKTTSGKISRKENAAKYLSEKSLVESRAVEAKTYA